MATVHKKKPKPTKHRKKKPPPPKRVHLSTVGAQYLQIVGSLSNGSTTKSHHITVLAGDDAPTVTGGFAKWGVIDRPQRVGMTILQGYDPVVLTVSLRFDAMIIGGSITSAEVERDIQILEWMGGRGKLFKKDGHTFAPADGDSPRINIYSANSSGDQTAMIPLNCQDIDYVMSGLSYDTKPSRDIHGNRVRQDATITLTQHIDAPGNSADSAATRARQRKRDQGQFVHFKVTAALDTIAKIMSLHYHDAKHDDWVLVLKDNKKRLRLGGSVHQKLKMGETLKVRKVFADHL